MSAAVAAQIVEQQRAIEVTAIEHGLSEFWNQTRALNNKPLHRTLTLNLIAVCAEERGAAMSETVATTLCEHPGHAYVVLLCGATGGFRATLRTRIRDGETRRQVLLQQIEITAPSGDCAKVPSVIRPLLVRDVPTLMYWSGTVPDDLTLFHKLGKLAHRTVYDSSLFADPLRDVARVESLAVPTFDLMELRLRAWRRSLALAFEHVDWQTGTRTEATIRHGDAPGGRAAAEQLRSWLRHHLDARVELIAIEDPDVPELEPASLDVAVADVAIAITHLRTGPHLRTVVTLGNHCMLPFVCTTTSASRGELLADAADLL